ncbi:MAG: helix-turn-helix domain-containing protein [Bacillota bacterium]|nr:MAG: hypothetical protein DIU55_06140 [Bacillota bacterium]
METTRSRILKAALQVISERGYNGATTAEIARRAGVAEGTIYRYFKDKKELFVACVEPVVHAALRREKRLPRTDDLRTWIRLRMRELVQVVRENRPVFDVLFTEGRFHPEIADIMLQHVVSAFTAQDREAFARALGDRANPQLPILLTVGLTAAIWAILQVGPGVPAPFAGLLPPDWYSRLDDDIADFFTNAIFASATE